MVNISAIVRWFYVLLPALLLAPLCQTRMPLFAHLSASRLASPQSVMVRVFRSHELRLHKEINNVVTGAPASAWLPLYADVVFCVNILTDESIARQLDRMAQQILSLGLAQTADTDLKCDSINFRKRSHNANETSMVEFHQRRLEQLCFVDNKCFSVVWLELNASSQIADKVQSCSFLF